MSARRKRRTSGTRQPETRTRELGAPVVVAARYPQELLAQIDAARADEPRQRWLVEAARQRLEREGSAIELHWKAYTYSGAHRICVAGPFMLLVGDDNWSTRFTVAGTGSINCGGDASDIHEAHAAAVAAVERIARTIDPHAVIRDHGTREAFECQIGADHEPADTVEELLAAALARREEWRPSAALIAQARALLSISAEREAVES